MEKWANGEPFLNKFLHYLISSFFNTITTSNTTFNFPFCIYALLLPL
jgi:hypothetical protein